MRTCACTRAPGRKPSLPVDEVIAVERLLGDYVELQDVATRKQIATLAAHTDCPVHAKSLRRAGRQRRGGGRALQGRGAGTSASRCSTCSRNFRPASCRSRRTWRCCRRSRRATTRSRRRPGRCRALQRHRRRGARRRRARAAAPSRACAPTTWRAPRPATWCTASCATPRPRASACPTIRSAR